MGLLGSAARASLPGVWPHLRASQGRAVQFFLSATANGTLYLDTWGAPRASWFASALTSTASHWYHSSIQQVCKVHDTLGERAGHHPISTAVSQLRLYVAGAQELAGGAPRSTWFLARAYWRLSYARESGRPGTIPLGVGEFVEPTCPSRVTCPAVHAAQAKPKGETSGTFV